MNEQISDVVVDKIVDILTEALQTNLDKADPVWVGWIQGGKLQDSPIVKGDVSGNSITVHIGDPDERDPTWVDEVCLPNDPYVKMAPVAEIGGTFNPAHWWRKGVVRVESFFVLKPENDRDEARQIVGELRRRVEDLLGRISGEIVGLTDTDNTETVVVFMPVKSSAVEAGGPRQHIWHTKIWWQALTYRT